MRAHRLGPHAGAFDAIRGVDEYHGFFPTSARPGKLRIVNHPRLCHESRSALQSALDRSRPIMEMVRMQFGDSVQLHSHASWARLIRKEWNSCEQMETPNPITPLK